MRRNRAGGRRKGVHVVVFVVVAKIEIYRLNFFVGLAPSPNFVHDSVGKKDRRPSRKKYLFN